MIRFTLVHDIHCAAERFWELHLDSAFTRALIEEGLGFHACDIQSVTREGDTVRRVMVVQPKIDVPQAVAKILGPRLSYREDGVYRADTGTWEWTTRLGVMADKIRMGGAMRVEPTGSDRCRRVADLWVDAKVFGLGGLVEKAAEKNMRKGWAEGARWTNAWLARAPADEPSGTGPDRAHEIERDPSGPAAT